MQARRLDKQSCGESDSNNGCEGKRRRSSHQEESAAVRIGAAARGHLARKRGAEEGVTQELRGLEINEAGEESAASGAMESADAQQHQRESEDYATASRTSLVTSAAAPGVEVKVAAEAEAAAVSDGLAEVEALGVVGVRAFFDSLGLGACANRLRESGGGIDGAELARIARSHNPDAELLGAGVSARLHRVKLLSALGVGTRVAGVTVPSTPPSLDERVRGDDGGGGGLARVTAIAALHMVRQLRKEQDVVADVLCKSSGVTPNRSRVDLGQELPPRVEDRLGGGASSDSKETVGTRAGASFVSLVLPEIEEVLSTQLQLSSQVGEAARTILRADGHALPS